MVVEVADNGGVVLMAVAVAVAVPEGSSPVFVGTPRGFCSGAGGEGSGFGRANGGGSD